MVNIKFSNTFKTKYQQELNQIINYYNTKPNNFNEFLNQLRNGKIKNHKNIIFTFSTIFDVIEHDNEIANKIIDDTDYEKSIENYIDNFFDSNDKKFMIFQIKEGLFEHLNYIENLIDNYLKNKKRKKIDLNKTQNYIIFIIHLKREILNNENKINHNFLSHLSSYNQLFIDNLNADNISITQFFDILNRDLFLNKFQKDEKEEKINFFNQKEIFNEIIYQGFMRFSYKFLNYPPIKDLTEENYHEYATQKLQEEENKEYIEIIQETIINYICESETGTQNIIELILKKFDFQQKSIDFVSDIKNYMKNVLLEFLVKILYKIQNDGVLDTILFYIKDQKNLHDYIINYFNDINLDNIEVSMNLSSNIINNIFGLTLPGVYPFLYKIRSFDNNIKKDFLLIEIKQRMLSKEKDLDNKKNELINNVQELFDKNNILKKCDKDDIDIFYQNYRTIFIIENLKQNKNLDNLFKFLLEMRFDERDLSDKTKVGEIILWIECYKYFIIYILKLCSELFIDYEQFKEIIYNKVNNKKENCDDDLFDFIHTSEPFNSIIEYFSSFGIENLNLFKEKFEFFDYICDIIIQNIEKFYIPCRFIFLFKSVIEAYKILYYDLNKFENFINEIKEEAKTNEIKILKQSWENEFNCLKDDINKKNIDNIISLFIIKYRQINNDEYSKFLFDMIYNNKDLLPYSQRFLLRILSKYSFSINLKLIEENEEGNIIFKEIKKHSLDLMIEYIDNKIKKNEEPEKVKTLIQILIYIYQSKIKIKVEEFEDYSLLMKFIVVAIDGEPDNKIIKNNIVYPNLTRIYCCVFMEKFLEIYLKNLVNMEINILIVKNFYHSLDGFKELSEKIKELMIKILFFNIFKQDYKKLEDFINETKDDYLTNFIGEDYKNYESINDNYKINYENQFYALNFILPKNYIQKYLNIKNNKKLDNNNNEDNSKSIENLDNEENTTLIKEINYSKKYPVLLSFLYFKELINKGKSHLNKLKNITIINDFENYLLHYFNSDEKIDRNKAKKTLLEDKINEINQKINIKEKYDKFKEIWNSEFSNFTYLVFEKKDKVKKVEKKSTLEDFLMDNKKGENGIQVKAIYENLINLQNEFIESIIENLKTQINNEKKSINNDENQLKIKENEYLYNELETKSSINIQNATNEEIINIEKINIEDYRSFEDLLSAFSQRKIFLNDNTINFNEYNKIEINYEQIEQYLKICLLYGKKKFTNKLNYIIYTKENNYSSNLNKFVERFGYVKLSKEKRDKIDNFEELIYNVLPSLDTLIFNPNKFSPNENVSNVINNNSKLFKLSQEFIKLCNELSLIIKELSGFYDYIEEKTFKKTIEKIKDQDDRLYKYENLIKIEVEKELEKNKNGVDKNSLLRAIRKFTIKYLLNNSNVISSDEKLFEYLQKDQGLWLYHKDDNDTFIQKRINEFDIINKLLENKTDILIKDTISFYNILTGIKFKKKKKKESEQDDMDIRQKIL